MGTLNDVNLYDDFKDMCDVVAVPSICNGPQVYLGVGRVHELSAF